MTNPTSNYGWPMPTSTDLVTDLPADFALFGQPVDTSLKALNPETTLGDISYRSATANTNTRLAIGTTGQLLTVAGGVPSWATPASSTPTFVGCAAYLSGAQSTTTSTATAILFDTELFDTDAFHSNVTNKERFTIPAGKAGYYLVTAQIQWTTGLTGYRNITLMLNAATLMGEAYAIVDNAGYPTPQCSVIVNLAVGDYIWARGEQSSGGALSMRANRGATQLSIGYLGA